MYVGGGGKKMKLPSTYSLVLSPSLLVLYDKYVLETHTHTIMAHITTPTAMTFLCL